MDHRNSMDQASALEQGNATGSGNSTPVDINNKYDDYKADQTHHTSVHMRHTIPTTNSRSDAFWKKLTPYSVYLAEFLGMLILTTLGDGVNAQNTFNTTNASSAWLGNALGWGMALMLGVYVSGGVSGGHINPAVTVAMVLYRKFPLRKVPGYFLAQFLGAFVGTAIVYGNYKSSIDNFDHGTHHVTGPLGTASIFVSFPQPFLTSASGFMTYIISSATLLVGVFAITDEKNMGTPLMSSLITGFLMMAIGLSISWPTGISMNPFLDLGGRCFAAIPYGVDVFKAYNHYFWAPLVGPFVGAVIGATLYQCMIGLVPHEVTMSDHKPGSPAERNPAPPDRFN
ncbi:glycerol channel [Haplosporangium sp. Z 27]|nr:glycerol channel [Haplosporangium sp. Z 27]